MPSPFANTFKRSDLAEAIASEIATAITSGRLAPGERLGEERVASALGVSRGPVREAARLLVARGLLVQFPRRGFFVRSFTLKEVDDLYDVRLALERHALKRLLGTDTRAVVAALQHQLDIMIRAGESGNERELAEADLGFHRLVCQHAGNARLLRQFDDLSAEVLILIRLLGQLYDDRRKIVPTHKPLIDALRRNDEAKVLRTIDDHIGSAWQKVRRLFNKPARASQ